MKRGRRTLVAGLVGAVCTIFMVGCGAALRFSTQTQYLGGVYGPGPVSSGAPQDYVSYWSGVVMDGIHGGVGMHAGYLPGYPASHGCIRMPEFMAENFFKSVSVGTPISITN